MVSFTQKVAGLAAAASVLVSASADAYTLNSEGRILIQVNNPETHAQVVADNVGDIWQDEPMIAFARPIDLPRLAKLGVRWTEVDVDLEEGLAKLQAYGGAPYADGSIVDVNGVLHTADEHKTWADIDAIDLDIPAAVRREDDGQVYRDDTWYGLYHPFTDIIHKAKTYAASAHPDLDVVFHDAISITHEGRRLPLIEFGGKNNADREKPSYWYYGANIHAREWVAGHGGLFAFREFMRLYGEGDAEVVEILDNMRVLYVPVLNPDGLEYSWKFDRYWRKNRRPFTELDYIGGSISPPGLRVVCPLGEVGVDVNRNWDFLWACCGGSSDDACSDTHHGSHGFSEREWSGLIPHIFDIKEKGGDFLGGVDFHTYGGLLLRPVSYGFIPENACPDNQAWMIRQTQRISDAVTLAGGINYKNQAGAALYIGSGTSKDWLYAVLTDNRYGLTPELRPSEDALIALGLLAGFSPPPTDILPGGMEAFMILKTGMADAVPVTKGLLPRIISDEQYLNFYGDEGYYTDEYNSVQFCLDPKPPVEPEAEAEPASEGETEAATDVQQANVDGTSSSDASSLTHTMTRAVAGVLAAATALFLA